MTVTTAPHNASKPLQQKMATCKQASKKFYLVDFEEKFLVTGSLRRQQQKYHKTLMFSAPLFIKKCFESKWHYKSCVHLNIALRLFSLSPFHGFLLSGSFIIEFLF